jgi:PhnB protein
MARTSTYLNFPRDTEAAFKFYKSVFGGDFVGPVARFGDMPSQQGAPALADADKNLIMHIELPILGGHVLMGTDAPESFGFTVNYGNNVYINLEPDSRAETDRLFAALSAGGKVGMPPQDMFWGAYFDRAPINSASSGCLIARVNRPLHCPNRSSGGEPGAATIAVAFVPNRGSLMAREPTPVYAGEILLSRAHSLVCLTWSA